MNRLKLGWALVGSKINTYMQSQKSKLSSSTSPKTHTISDLPVKLEVLDCDKLQGNRTFYIKATKSYFSFISTSSLIAHITWANSSIQCSSFLTKGKEKPQTKNLKTTNQKQKKEKNPTTKPPHTLCWLQLNLVHTSNL